MTPSALHRFLGLAGIYAALRALAARIAAQDTRMTTIQDTIVTIQAEVADLGGRLDSFVSAKPAGEAVTDEERAELQGIADGLKGLADKLPAATAAAPTDPTATDPAATEPTGDATTGDAPSA